MRRLAFGVVAWALLAVAPTGDAAASVELKGGFFDPGTLPVAPGERVTFTNVDEIAHTVTSTWDEGESFDVILAPGEFFEQAFPSDGTFTIHCRPHAGMEMSVEVADMQVAASLASEEPASSGAFLPLILAGVASLCLMLMPPRSRR